VEEEEVEEEEKVSRLCFMGHGLWGCLVFVLLNILHIFLGELALLPAVGLH